MLSQSPPAFPLAPLERGEVGQALAPFGQSRMLPPAAYTSPAVFAWERRHFFGGGWVCAARAAQLPSPGDRIATDCGVLLSRGSDDVVRAFANTCPHRGHELLPSGPAAGELAANGKAIVCPYHSWTFSLSGELLG